MKKVVFALLGSLLAFGMGLAGVYFSLPLLAPEQAAVVTDSLQTADSLHQVAGRPDSLAVSDTSVAWLGAPSSVVEQGVNVALRDSLDQMRATIDSLRQNWEALNAQVDAMQHQLEAATRRRVEAKDLSATLTKLEEKDLEALVERLDPYVLKMLYQEASGRNQSRLLQALPADYAARFVQQLIDPAPVQNVEVPVEPDTLEATSQASLLETATSDRLP